MSRTILIVDDDPAIRDILGRFFAQEGWIASTAETGRAGLEQFEAEQPDVVLLDLVLPDLMGTHVLQRLRELDPDPAVVMLTGHGDIATAVQAMQLGAENFLTKPFKLEHLQVVAQRAAEKAELRRRNRYLAGSLHGAPELDGLGVSPEMHRIGKQIEHLAQSESTVLLLGETGTGKGWVAQLIHRLSERRQQPFVEASCGGLTATFLDAELFGHEKGAFAEAHARKHGLLEIANRGTIFLDEIGDLPEELQPKLAKVLETRQFRRLGGTRTLETDVRLIAASNHDLEQAVERGRFRKDLFYRLASMPVRLPPLRERSADDIAALARTILRDLRQRIGAGPTTLSDDALDHMVRHAWSGNIRELRNVLERILITDPGAEAILPEHLPPEIRDGGEPEDIETLEDLERRHIRMALEQHGGNRSRAARALGIARATLYDKIDRFDLQDVGR